jgi:hypothetical protein
VPSEADGFGFGIAPSVLGKEIIRVTIGRIDNGAAKDGGIGRETKAGDYQRENNFHSIRDLRSFGVSAFNL